MMDALAYVDLQDTGNAQSQLLLVAIARCVDWETGQGFPGIDRLAKMAKCSPRTVQNHLARLVEQGFVTVEARTDKRGRQTSNLYTICGYADWLATLRKGGTVAAPKSVEKYQDADVPTPQDLRGPEQDLRGEGESSLHPRGCKQAAPYLTEDLKNDLKGQNFNSNKEEKPQPARPALSITPADGLKWGEWLAFLPDDKREAAEYWGEIISDRRWPKDATYFYVKTKPRDVTGEAA